MKIKQSISIENNVVELVGTQGNLVYYATCAQEDDNKTLYITDLEGNVIGKLYIEADMGQGIGYVSDIVCLNISD